MWSRSCQVGVLMLPPTIRKCDRPDIPLYPFAAPTDILVESQPKVCQSRPQRVCRPSPTRRESTRTESSEAGDWRSRAAPNDRSDAAFYTRIMGAGSELRCVQPCVLCLTCVNAVVGERVTRIQCGAAA